MMTNDPDSRCTITDEYSRPVKGNFYKCSTLDGIVDFGDIDPMAVSLSFLEDVDMIEL